MSFQPYTIEADRHLEQRVGQALAGLHFPSLRQVKVSARGGTVTLSGRVSSFHEKELAQHSSVRIPGVAHVVDFLRVTDPRDPSPAGSTVAERPATDAAVQPATQEIAERRLDYRLQVRVVAALAHEPAFQRLAVQVTDKVARLEGIVATQELKDTAGELARRVTTVARVDNQIIVAPAALREIARTGKAAIAWQTADRRATLRAFAVTAAVLLLGLGWHYGWSQAEAQGPARPTVVAVQGHLTVDGAVPAGAMVIFHRQDSTPGTHPTPMGIVAADGTYRLTTFEADDGAPPGEYTVTIFWNPGAWEGAPLASPLPDRFMAVQSSPLKATITATTERVPLKVNVRR